MQKKAIKIKVLDYLDILSGLPVQMPLSLFEEYLNAGRQDILSNVDIFCENVRTVNREDKDFSLFEKVDLVDKDTVIIFPIYLELFEYQGRQDNLSYCIHNYSLNFRNNKVVFFWNHDNDFSRFNSFIENYPNIRIINFGYTSKRGKNDITVSFWNINTNELKEEKDKFISFIGTANNQFRAVLANNIINYGNKDVFDFKYGLSQQDFYKEVSRTKFSLCPMGGHGGGGFSYRFFECFFLNTIPVILVDTLVWPYQEFIDWSKICIHIEQKYVNDLDYIRRRCEEVNYDEMMKNIEDSKKYFRLSGIQNYIHSRLNEEL